jgi:hypothetical protein
LTLLSEIPSFFTDQLGFHIQSAGLLGIIPFLALFLSTILFGIIFEYCQVTLQWKVNTIRQTAGYIAFGASSIVLILCGFMKDPFVAYSFMILTEVK